MTANQETIHSENWPSGTTSATWSSTWTPTSEGAYTLEAILTISGGQLITDMANTIVYIDASQPTVTLDTNHIIKGS